MNVISAGGVVYRISNGNYEIKLITTKAWKYTLPKGRVENSDSVEDTAIREVKEEAGVDATIDASLGSIEWKIRSGAGVKTVFLFLMKCINDGPVNDPDNEILSAEWKSLDEAIELVDFPPMKKIVISAARLLDSKKSHLCAHCFNEEFIFLNWCKSCLIEAQDALEKRHIKKYNKGSK